MTAPATGPTGDVWLVGNPNSGCYICRPGNPNASPEGCADCDHEAFRQAAALAEIVPSVEAQMTGGRVGRCDECRSVIKGGDGICGECMGGVFSDA